MKQAFFVFAAGLPGIGLMLLRCSVAAFLISIPLQQPSISLVAVIALGVLAGLIAIGFRSRLAALFACIIGLLLMIKSGDLLQIQLGTFALNAAALAFTGPGSYSLDSRLFGRRTVRLPD